MTRPGVGEIHADDIDWGGAGHAGIAAAERAPEGALYELLEDARLPTLDAAPGPFSSPYLTDSGGKSRAESG